MLAADSPLRISQISMKAAASGLSSGGRLRQVRTINAKVPKSTVLPTGASMVMTRPVTLSMPCRMAVS